VSINVSKNIDTLHILCPYCSSPYTASMEAEYDYSGESEETGRWGEEITIEVYCDNCKKLVYKKTY